MGFNKALITAAAADQHTLPVQSLAGRDRDTNSALCILIEEVLIRRVFEVDPLLYPFCGPKIRYEVLSRHRPMSHRGSKGISWSAARQRGSNRFPESRASDWDHVSD